MELCHLTYGKHLIAIIHSQQVLGNLNSVSNRMWMVTEVRETDYGQALRI